ncbi:MAG: hypothetical protein V4719_29095 [Planctomycetota bacterium]
MRNATDHRRASLVRHGLTYPTGPINKFGCITVGDMIDQCSLCKAPVLGIQGNDLVIQPYFLHTREGAILESIAGSVHSSCLHESPYSQNYHDAMRVYVTNHLRSRLFRECENGFIARHDNTLDLIVVFDLTFSIRLSSKQVAKTRIDAWGMQVPCKSQINVHRILRKLEVDSLLNDFKHGGIKLAHLMDLTENTQKMGPYTRLEGAVLRPYADDPEASIGNLHKHVICGELFHEVLLPPDISEIIRSFSS